ncbi:hypothetical protein [Algoriphagus algorifonticola]|uniref:hypothetical protein n=1 Tax=Algoriphagus algorifonticola TaxID=2593007 RepID=UPI0011A1C108|nr:hypothetical protein [Algoriphagus algorifonticola]
MGWADVFTRKVYRDLILENLSYCSLERGLYLYSYLIMSNHIHWVLQQKDGELSGQVLDFKKFMSKKLLKMILDNPHEIEHDPVGYTEGCPDGSNFRVDFLAPKERDYLEN